LQKGDWRHLGPGQHTIGIGEQHRFLPFATLYNPLFTTGADSVDFNNLTAPQQQAIAAGADRTHGLGGNDNVTLPNSGNATFYTGSTTSDKYYLMETGRIRSISAAVTLTLSTPS
jgi:hypothetical protein